MRAQSVETSVPLSAVPEAGDIGMIGLAGIDATPAPTSATTVWHQDLQFVAYLEAIQEPTVATGEPIEEVRIIRHLRENERTLDTERVRRFADREEVVDELPE